MFPIFHLFWKRGLFVGYFGCCRVTRVGGEEESSYSRRLGELELEVPEHVTSRQAICLDLGHELGVLQLRAREERHAVLVLDEERRPGVAHLFECRELAAVHPEKQHGDGGLGGVAEGEFVNVGVLVDPGGRSGVICVF